MEEREVEKEKRGGLKRRTWVRPAWGALPGGPIAKLRLLVLGTSGSKAQKKG